MVQWFLSFVLLVLTTVWEVERAGGGAEKKAEATKKILDHLNDKNQPLSVPNWLPQPILSWLISKAIDIAVSKLQDFFGK